MVFSRWLLLIKGLVGSQHVPFGPTAETAVGQVIRDLTGYAAGADRMAEITIPQLWEALNNPTDAAGHRLPLLAAGSTSSTRPARCATRSASLVKGHLAGLFDAATTVTVDWRAPIQSLSLSRLDPLGDEAVGVALTCLNSWGRAMTQVAEPGDLRIIIRDECWKQMRLGTDAVKSLDADLRLSRRDGCIQVVIAHKPSRHAHRRRRRQPGRGDRQGPDAPVRDEGAARPGRPDRRRAVRPARPHPDGRNASSPTGPPRPRAARCGWSARTWRRCRPCARRSTSR